MGPRISGDFENEHHLHSVILNSKKLRGDEEVNKLKRKLFNNVPPNQAVSIDIRKQIRHARIEFVVNYRKKGEENGPVSPETMMGYIRGILPAFEKWGYSMELFKDPVFTDKKEGLFAVMDNRFADQQSLGASTVHKNTLSMKDFCQLLNSTACDVSTPDGYLNRLLLVVGVCLDVRTTKMSEMIIEQFDRDTMIHDRKVIVFLSVVSDRTGISKNRPGGINSLGLRLTEVVIWNLPILDGSLNVFEVFDDYVSLRENANLKTN